MRKPEYSAIVGNSIYAKIRDGGLVVGIGSEASKNSLTNALEVWLKPKEIQKLAAKCMAALAADPSASIDALLLGGPRHGDFVKIPRDNPPFYNYVQFDNPGAVPVDSTRAYTEHIYTRANDIIFFGVPLPFALYEHDSLRGANVSREADRLDRELEKAIDQETKAKEKVKELVARRAKIQHDHGL